MALGNPIRKLVQLVLDKAAAKKTEDDAKKTLSGVDKAMKDVGETAKKIGTWIAGAFAVREIIRWMQSVDEARGRLVTLTGATGETLRGLQRDTQAVFAQVPQSIEEVATAVGTLNTLLGLTDEPLQHVTKSALDFADVNNMDVAASATLVGQLLNRYGLSADAADD